jgi:rhodanese-related sulfurtransferase
MTRKDFKGILVLVFFSLITAFSYNFLSLSGLPLSGQWEPSKGVVSARSKTDSVNADIQINNAEMIRQIVKYNKRIILDVRPREIYNQGHLPGALSFPLSRFDENIVQILDSIEQQSPLLLYCSSVECTDSHTFAKRLQSLRYDNIKVYSGGFRQWMEKGYEIEKNEG